MAQPADPIRRPAPVTPTSLIAASWSAAIGGSVWPTRSGSVPPVLDSTGHLSRGAKCAAYACNCERLTKQRGPHRASKATINCTNKVGDVATECM